MNPRYTVLEIAERLSLTKETTRGLVNALVDLGLAHQRGVRAPESGRGAPEKVFDFVDGYEKMLISALRRANLNG